MHIIFMVIMYKYIKVYTHRYKCIHIYIWGDKNGKGRIWLKHIVFLQNFCAIISQTIALEMNFILLMYTSF